ncbi:hypothetical protein [Luteithermobacter gelatinilyticus]|uniref:hypothetical protein n=1 Tax=Luteithermobacter gelatinilyticus TaxID=2582913 RepID=UPI0011066BF5|nr:hypothetical protein [Luteithermobacter gelatinilyticus]
MKVENLAYHSVDPNQIPDQGAVETSPQDVRPKARPAPEPRDVKPPLSEDQLSVSPVWQQVADRITVRHATPVEMIDLSRTLYNTGTISFEDHVNLSFQPEINADADNDPAAHEKKDFIALWEKKLETAVRQGADREELETIQRIQGILGYLDSLNPE